MASSGITDTEVEIPKDGFLICDLRTDDSPLPGFKPGQEVKLFWDTESRAGLPVLQAHCRKQRKRREG